MTCIKRVWNKDTMVNELYLNNENAYRELSILLINKINKKQVKLYCSINIRGLHEIKGTEKINADTTYEYRFIGKDVESLPIICG